MKMDIVNDPDFIAAVEYCVEKSIDACNDCDADYDEEYLRVRHERRLLDAYGKNCKTKEQLIAYAEANFAF